MGRKPGDIEPRLIIALWGDAKTGKTHTCLTFPEPIVFINFDYGVDELVDPKAGKFPGLNIEIEDIPIHQPGEFESAQGALAHFHSVFDAGLQVAEKFGGTVAVDNGSFLWDLVSFVKKEEAFQARFRKQSKAATPEELKESRFDWGPANNYMNAVLRRAYHYPRVNLVITHAARNRYNERGQETSELQYQGFKQVPALVQAMIQTFKDDGKFSVMIERSRHAPHMEGLHAPSEGYKTIREMLLGV